MSNSYIPIPSSSDNEENNTPMSEDEDSESTRGYPYVPVRTDTDTDEEEPEEDVETNSWEDNRSVPSSFQQCSFEVPAPPRQTARIRVATPERVTLSPDHVVPTPDRHQMEIESCYSWDLTLKTLRNWRNIALGRSNHEQGGTSEQHEPLLDTTPIIVDRMLSHENRMDLLEDAVIHLPEPEAYDAIEDHLTQTGEEIIGLKEEVRRLTAKLESSDLKIKDLESSIEDLLWRSHAAELGGIISFEERVQPLREKKQTKDEN